MSEMHPDTVKVLHEIIRAEVVDDPTHRGYAGKKPAEIADLMNAPTPAAVPPPEKRPFAWGAARGVAQAHGCWPLITIRARGTPTLPIAKVEDAAILAAINAVETERDQMIDPTDPAVWAAFQGGIAAFQAVGDLTPAAAAAILALADHQPPAPPDGQPRWVIITSGLSTAETPPDKVDVDEGTGAVVVIRHPGYAGAPNAVTEALIAEALNG